jgi:hypothetical protein
MLLMSEPCQYLGCKEPSTTTLVINLEEGDVERHVCDVHRDEVADVGSYREILDRLKPD